MHSRFNGCCDTTEHALIWPITAGSRFETLSAPRVSSVVAMKLLFATPCIFALIKVLSGASLLSLYPKVQQIKEYMAQFQRDFDNGQFGSGYDIMGQGPEIRVWHYFKHFGTPQQADKSLISDLDLSEFCYFITLADNPACIEQLPSDLRQDVMEPIDLMHLDAVRLATMLPDQLVFTDANLQKYGAAQISELKEKRDAFGFDLDKAVQTGNTFSLDFYILQGLWTPSIFNIVDAIDANAQEGLLYLLNKVKWVPDPYYIGYLADNGRQDALDCICASNPEWKPSQKDFNDSIANGSKGALEFYVSIDPDMSLSEESSLKSAYVNRYWSVLEICLQRWPQYFSNALKGEQKLELKQVTLLAEDGHSELLEWYFKAYPDTSPPIKAVLLTALKRKHFRVLEVCTFAYPGLKTTILELVNAAAIQGNAEALDWYGGFDPDWNLSLDTIAAAGRNGNLHVREWALNRNSPELCDKVKLLMALSQRGK